MNKRKLSKIYDLSISCFYKRRWFMDYIQEGKSKLKNKHKNIKKEQQAQMK